MPDSNPHGHIYVDLVMAFARSCQREVDGPGRDALYQFISSAVVAGIEGGQDYWTNRTYLLGRFRTIGDRVNARVQSGGRATREVMVEACNAEVDSARRQIQARAASQDPAERESAEREGPVCDSFTPEQLAGAAPSFAVEPEAGPESRP